MRALGMLAGVGSLLREAHDAGFEVIGNVETRSFYRTAKHLSWDLNFPHVPLITADWFDAEALGFLEPDLLLGHPPCGSHSQLGRSVQHKHLSAEHRQAQQSRRWARVGLMPYFVNQVNTLRPRMFALDNLPKILDTSLPPEWWKQVLPKYHLTFIRMKNWDYGTPQMRHRLWVVGVRKPGRPFKFKPTKKRILGPATSMEAFEELAWEPWLNDPELGHVHLEPGQAWTGYRTTVPDLKATVVSHMALGFLSIPPGKLWPYVNAQGRHTVKIGRFRLRTDYHSKTLTGMPTTHHPLTGWPLTPRERARLMDWPDDFQLGNEHTTYDRRSLMRLILFTGKAVPSGFPRYLLPQIRRHLKR